MRMIGEAVASGAVSVVSALATGKGAAIGVGLTAKAHVELRPGTTRITRIGMRGEVRDFRLVVACVKRVLNYFKKNRFGALVRVQSNIPIARGLKSSSAVSNAVVLATANALGQSLNPLRAVSLGVDAAWQAGVTKTGAFDDAVASMLGGVAVTDNRKRQLIRRYGVPNADRLGVLILVPPWKRFTGAIQVNRSSFAREMSKIAFEEAERGRWLTALTLNGIVQCAVYSMDLTPAIDAIRAGAMAAGLSGKGPATAAVSPKANLKRIRAAWKPFAGKIVETRITNQAAIGLR